MGWGLEREVVGLGLGWALEGMGWGLEREEVGLGMD